MVGEETTRLGVECVCVEGGVSGDLYHFAKGMLDPAALAAAASSGMGERRVGGAVRKMLCVGRQELGL